MVEEFFVLVGCSCSIPTTKVPFSIKTELSGEKVICCPKLKLGKQVKQKVTNHNICSKSYFGYTLQLFLNFKTSKSSSILLNIAKIEINI
jgi:hypothetical protein